MGIWQKHPQSSYAQIAPRSGSLGVPWKTQNKAQCPSRPSTTTTILEPGIQTKDLKSKWVLQN